MTVSDELNASDIDTDDLVSEGCPNFYDQRENDTSNHEGSENPDLEKPWIKRMTAEEFSREYGHLTVTIF